MLCLFAFCVVAKPSQWGSHFTAAIILNPSAMQAFMSWRTGATCTGCAMPLMVMVTQGGRGLLGNSLFSGVLRESGQNPRRKPFRCYLVDSERTQMKETNDILLNLIG
jgi:hypothetical protein